MTASSPVFSLSLSFILQIAVKLPILIVQKYEKNSRDLESLEILRRGDTFEPSSSSSSSSSTVTENREDVHMNLLKHTTGPYLPSHSGGDGSGSGVVKALTPTSSTDTDPETDTDTSTSSSSLTSSQANSRTSCGSEGGSEGGKRGLSATGCSLRHSPPPYSGQYMVVLVHGFQGTNTSTNNTVLTTQY